MKSPKKLIPMMRNKLIAAAGAVFAANAIAGTDPMDHVPEDKSTLSTWEKFNDWSIGGILFPNVHLHGVGGFSTGDTNELATGGHDPRRESFSAQAIEPGISLRTAYLEGFANYLWFQDGEGDWDGELEEAFGKIINLPGGFEIKGGQFLSRFGAQNSQHLHSLSTVDSPLVLSRFLGDDGLLLRGGEVSWTIPTGTDPYFVSIASIGYGETRPHDHAHGGHEEEHDHGHGQEVLFEGEEGSLADSVFTARLMGRYRFSDFHSVTAGVSWAGGDNGFDRSTNVAGIDVEYLWRERGLEPSGRGFRWRNEFLWREVEAFGETEHEDDHEEEHEEEHHEEDEHDHSETITATRNEIGLYSSAVYTWNDHLDIGLRAEWVEGIEDFGQEERLRISPSISYWVDSARRIGTRVQYNYDRLEGNEDEHTLWFQVNIALGGTGEVR